ncbi:MAG: F0F1 ATP synthase subunit B [Candidatus Limnocylindrales bacterium]
MMDLFAVADGVARDVLVYAAEAAHEETGFQINLFWIIVSALNFLVFFIAAWQLALKPVVRQLHARRERIEQGLRDADAARTEREAAQEQRQVILTEARREANDIIARAQRTADEARDQGVAETRSEIERLRAQAVSEIDAERLRALGEVRAQVADLALQAAGRVVGETMNSDRERRLVNDFLVQVAGPGPEAAERN